MTSQTLVLAFAGLALYHAAAVAVYLRFHQRWSVPVKLALLFVFYVGARFSLRLVPVGIVPYLAREPLFYALFAALHLAAVVVFVRRREHLTWRELGFRWDRPLLDLAAGAAGAAAILAPLAALGAVLGDAESGAAGPRTTSADLVIAVSFGLVLGGFAEEAIFRGYVYAMLRDLAPLRLALAQATVFSASHAFYFPLDAHAFFYGATFLLGLGCGLVRTRWSTTAAAWMHGLSVVATVLFPDALYGWLFAAS